MHKPKSVGAQTDTAVRERRYIYNGESRPTAPGYAIRSNRRIVRRKISTFYVILVLFGFGIGIVFYVNNILTVNQLAFDISQLEQRLDSVRNVNAALRAEVTRKAALERIGVLAREDLKMQFPSEQATTLDVDMENLPEVRKH
jgi:cell division protein FtsL